MKSYSDNNEKHSYLTLTVKIPAINEKLCDINEEKTSHLFKRNMNQGCEVIGIAITMHEKNVVRMHIKI